MSQDEQLHVTAVKAKIQAQLNAIGSTDPAQALDLEDVPSPRPDYFVEVSVARRYGGESRLDGYIGTTGWRIYIRVVAKGLEAARQLRKAVSDALLNQNLTVSGSLTTPVLFETEDPIVEDDDYYVGPTDWTYTL